MLHISYHQSVAFGDNGQWPVFSKRDVLVEELKDDSLTEFQGENGPNAHIRGHSWSQSLLKWVAVYALSGWFAYVHWEQYLWNQVTDSVLGFRSQIHANEWPNDLETVSLMLVTVQWEPSAAWLIKCPQWCLLDGDELEIFQVIECHSIITSRKPAWTQISKTNLCTTYRESMTMNSLSQRLLFGKHTQEDEEVSCKRRKRLLLVGFWGKFIMEMAFIWSLKYGQYIDI